MQTVVKPFITIVLVMLFFPGCDSPWEKIEASIEQMDEVSQVLAVRSAEVHKLSSEYSAEIKKLMCEIKRVREASQLTIEAARQNDFITQRVALIQQREQYLQFLQEYNGQLDAAISEIAFLSQKADADLKMEKILERQNISELNSKIKKTLYRYKSFEEELKIKNSKKYKSSSLHDIWQRLEQ